MSRIRRLAPDVANRIAAGEVVERPASLAKELVENSIDAGATRIEIAFEGGGIEMIRVADDGSGILPDDVELAFERHATSKVWDPADLVAIGTLGFRGEALASIAAVSRLEILTSTDSDSPGVRLRLEGGHVTAREAGARARGTTIEITGLFFNTPARRAFLKTPATEGRLLTRLLGQLALGASGIGLRVVREGRVVLDVAPGDGFAERTAAILGAETAARMVRVVAAREGVEARGLVSPADFTRTRTHHQILLVNGRPIVDGSIAHAVTAGIGGAVPGGKHPIFALSLTVDPSEVDVNVHPTKREVRFRKKDLVYSVVREAVSAGVLATSFDALGRTGSLPWKRAGVRPAAPVTRPGAPGPAGSAPARGSGDPVAPSPPAVEASPAGSSGQPPSSFAEPPAGDRPVRPGPTPPAPTGADSPSGPTGRLGTSGSLALRHLRLVGELWGAYLLVEDEDRLLVIDQHAAHERVLYDEIREVAHHPGKIPVQGLLVPLGVDLAPGQDPEEAAALLVEAGFDARPGGPSSLLVDGVPGSLTRWGGGEFLRELFASAEGATASAERFRDSLAKQYSCKGAVKFNQRLHREEIEHLLRGLERTDVPRLCPHGRPIYLEITKSALDDRFER